MIKFDVILPFHSELSAISNSFHSSENLKLRTIPAVRNPNAKIPMTQNTISYIILFLRLKWAAILKGVMTQNRRHNYRRLNIASID